MHIEAKYFRIRDLVADGTFRLVKVPSADQQADLLVAFKGRSTFDRLRLAVKGSITASTTTTE